jgi:FADH2 O2-dependent halogenase
LLSTGFPLTLLGVKRLAEAIEKDWGTDRFEEQVNTYARQTVLELAAAEELVAAPLRRDERLSIFVPLSLLYFAAASFPNPRDDWGEPSWRDRFSCRTIRCSFRSFTLAALRHCVDFLAAVLQPRKKTA